MRSLRVLLQPLFSGAERQPITTTHAQVSLLRMGAGLSQLKVQEKKPAELVFHVAYLKKARKATPSFTELARVSGELERGAQRSVFNLPEGWDFELTAPEAPDDPARYLLLGMTAPNFSSQGTTPQRKLLLPAVPKGTVHVELGIDLLVEGSLENARTQSDLLDIPLRLVPADVEGRLRLAVGMQFADYRLVDRPYRVTVAGETISGIIPETGEIVLPRRVTSGSAVLEVQPFENANSWYRWDLEIGALTGGETPAGVQSRLNSQGFDAGPINGELGPQAQAALRAFQQHHGLLADGSATLATQKKLVERHGC